MGISANSGKLIATNTSDANAVNKSAARRERSSMSQKSGRKTAINAIKSDEVKGILARPSQKKEESEFYAGFNRFNTKLGARGLRIQSDIIPLPSGITATSSPIIVTP